MATNSLEICNEALSEIGARNITSLTANAAKEDRICNQFYAKLRDSLLMNYPWNFAKKATPLNRTDLYETSDDYSDYVTITGATKANPIVITGTNSYSVGQIVYIQDVGGMDEINNAYFEVGVANTATFSLLGVDGAKFTAYSSGGKAIRAEPMTDYRSGYTYVIPTDCLKPISLDSKLPFEIIEDRLVTTDESPILIYVKQVTDTTKFSTLFEKCLKFDLAMTLCRPILGAKEGTIVRDKIRNDYNIAFIEAARQEANSARKNYTYTDTWTQGRG